MSFENSKSLMPFEQMKQCGFSARWGMKSNPTNGSGLAVGPESNKTHTFLLYNALILQVALITIFILYVCNNNLLGG